MPTWAMWAVCLGLLAVRGLLAAMEAALYGTSDLKAKELVAVHPRRGPRVQRLKTEREASTASLRFGAVLAGFTAAGIGTQVTPRILQVSLQAFSDSPWLSWLVPLSGALLIGLVASIIDVMFRAWASARPEAWALSLSGLGSASGFVLYPLMRAMVAVLNIVASPLGAKITFAAPAPPLEELEKLLAERAAKEKLDKGTPQMIRSIFELSDKTCRDVMVPRTDVVLVDASTRPQEILRVLAEQGHSRLPVYKGDVDHIVGILHVRDLVPLMQEPELIVLHDLLRPAVFVPWVKPIGDLLREMQKQKIHLSVVVDEYGGFMGIVTLEDILREIVGDIGDEFEEDVKLIDRQTDGSFLVDAMLPPLEFARAFALELPEGEYETLGGFLSHLAGAIPEVGDKFHVNGWTFAVASKEGPRLDRIKVTKPKVEKKDAAAEGLPLLPPRPSPARR
ncbi:MAG: HlyC/CorC family transporter [Archangiaceae bacterium]|nr:HlyC/CorC family transporter [Archangiaceae bacterium]